MAEEVMAAEDKAIADFRYEEAPSDSATIASLFNSADSIQQRKQDAIQAIIAHCLDAEQEVKEAGHPPDEFHARRLVGYLRRTLQSILEECKRLT
jgi:hypothetical protein